jgi:hypothetical protein
MIESKLLPLAFLAILAAGCATIFTGTSDTLDFDSNVPGTRLTVDGQFLGELPLKISMSRGFVGGKTFRARFEAEGYATQEFDLHREFNTVAILDISSTLVSGGVDVLTGALMRFSPTAYHVQMLPQGQGVSSPGLRRSMEAWRFGLFNYGRLQTELARGGGEYLSTFASVVAGGDAAAARLISEQSLRNAPFLVTAASAPLFLARFDGVLAGDASLRGYRLE